MKFPEVHSSEAEGASSAGPEEAGGRDEGEEGEGGEKERAGPETEKDCAGQPQIKAEMEREGI